MVRLMSVVCGRAIRIEDLGRVGVLMTFIFKRERLTIEGLTADYLDVRELHRTGLLNRLAGRSLGGPSVERNGASAYGHAQ